MHESRRFQHTAEGFFLKEAGTIVGRLTGVAPGAHIITVRASIISGAAALQIGSIAPAFFMEIQEVEGVISPYAP